MGVKLVAMRPAEPGEGSVIRFTNYDSKYTYAALRAGELWFITQDGTAGSWSRLGAMDWDELLDWLGTDNWYSLELLS